MAGPEGLETPCPLCSGTKYTWGSLLGQGLKYIPETEGWQSKTASLISELKARHCQACGNVQLFVLDGIQSP